MSVFAKNSKISKRGFYLKQIFFVKYKNMNLKHKFKVRTRDETTNRSLKRFYSPIVGIIGSIKKLS